VNVAAHTFELLLLLIGFVFVPTSAIGAEDDARAIVGGESLDPILRAKFR